MDQQEIDGYELFRRAILERDDAAWAAIHARYRALLISWVYHSTSRIYAGEWCDDLADQALARAWVALTPARFADFPTLPRLLGYLHTCVMTTVIDNGRARASSERTLNKLEVGAVATPEQIVLAEVEREELWRVVSALATTRAEQVVLVESLAYGFPPRTILARHPQLFADVAAVYSAKRNLFARLQRNRDLLRINDEYASI
jgi:hypothetical protein